MIRKKILNYEIKSLIGEGGMGAVYLAEHVQFKRKVAIKALLSKYLTNEQIKLRFKNEASTLAHLQHPNIVGLYDYLEDELGMYLIMEYVEGTQLDDYITKVSGPMPEEKAIPLMKQIIAAFAYAHEKGIIHRDIKPANILITKSNEAKILDFGIAKFLGEGNQNMTKTGTQMGSVYYMSPEQVQGKKADVRSDIYSLGVTFYQLLTGVNPYKSLTTEYEIYTKIVKENLPPADEIYPSISKYLVRILQFALEKDPNLRFQNCDEFLIALDKKSTSYEKLNLEKEDLEINKQPLKQIKKESTALVLGIIAIFFSFFPPINFISIILAVIAIILGNKEEKALKTKTLDANNGRSGKILGWIAILLSLLIETLSILFLLVGFVYLPDFHGSPDGFDGYNNEIGISWDGCPKGI